MSFFSGFFPTPIPLNGTWKFYENFYFGEKDTFEKALPKFKTTRPYKPFVL